MPMGRLDWDELTRGGCVRLMLLVLCAVLGAAQEDLVCAMAYWGVARTWYHPIWAPPSPYELKQGAAALDRALAIDAKTDRERDYVNALAVFYKNWETVPHVTRARNYEQALAGVRDR